MDSSGTLGALPSASRARRSARRPPTRRSSSLVAAAAEEEQSVAKDDDDHRLSDARVSDVAYVAARGASGSLASRPLKTGTLDVSGVGVELPWSAHTCILDAGSLSIVKTATGMPVAVLPLGSYESLRLRGTPDAIGCIQLEPSGAQGSAGRAWLRPPTAPGSGSAAARKAVLEEWLAAFAFAKAALEREARAATQSQAQAPVNLK